RELVDPVDALDPAQPRRAVQGEAGSTRREERQRLLELGPGQVRAQAVAGARAEGERPAGARGGDAERRQVKIGHKVHNSYDGTPLLHVVKWLRLALPRRFTLHDA